MHVTTKYVHVTKLTNYSGGNINHCVQLAGIIANYHFVEFAYQSILKVHVGQTFFQYNKHVKYHMIESLCQPP